MKYAVKADSFSATMTVGRVNKEQNALLDDKEECTDMVLFAVADYVRTHFDGGLRFNFTDHSADKSFDLEIRLSESIPAESAPVTQP